MSVQRHSIYKPKAGPHHSQTLTELRTICGENLPLMAYGNVGYVVDEQGWINTDFTDPKRYLKHAQSWLAKIIGACGSTPERIRK